MLKQIFKYFFSLSLGCCPLLTFAQGPEKDEKKDFIPTGLRVGIDLIGVGQTFLEENRSEIELNLDADLYRYFLNLEVGRIDRTQTARELSYINEGFYYRAGIDINFLHKDPDRSALFVGFRYASASFDDRLNTQVTDDLFGDRPVSLSNNNVQARWGELTTGLKVKLWKIVWMGYTARFKFGLSVNNDSNFTPHEVPGYGLAGEDTYWGFDYYLFIRLPVRKEKKIVEP